MPEVAVEGPSIPLSESSVRLPVGSGCLGHGHAGWWPTKRPLLALQCCDL